ncbi:carboxypeptidase regulatory-like domain-containing protein [Prosthecobacter sp.]|jgi:plastocyanin|uniref:carboxypeptidase regulatory-like domain-containing protein n=1 Tax=Prosthecobacter sp. TaxID=1965333 RepID=UPI0037832424
MSNVKHVVSRKASLAAFGIVVLTANVSCGKMPETPAGVSLSPAVEIAETTSIAGKVTLKGADSAKLRQVVDVGGNPFCTGHGEIINPAWRVGADGSLADAVITVRGSQRASNLPSSAPLIDQTKCEFVPHTLAIQAGQNVRFHNSDLTFHNIRIARHSAAGKENIANLGQPSRGDENVQTFNSPGIYRLECDVHRWMNAWVFVHEGIHAAVSAADGRFAINRALRDGDYIVEAWHPQFSEPLSQTVTVRDGKATVDFVFDYAQAIQL